jgi:hypothetical protein
MHKDGKGNVEVFSLNFIICGRSFSSQSNSLLDGYNLVDMVSFQSAINLWVTEPIRVVGRGGVSRPQAQNRTGQLAIDLRYELSRRRVTHPGTWTTTNFGA